MAYEFEEPAGADLMMVDYGCEASLTEANGVEVIQLTGSTGRQLTFPADDAPALAALLLALWRECDCDSDCPDCGDDL